jgi:hypothetical protein
VEVVKFMSAKEDKIETEKVLMLLNRLPDDKRADFIERLKEIAQEK